MSDEKLNAANMPTTTITAPANTGVPSIWDDNVAAGLTPARVANILQAAATGDADEYLTLAEQLEEIDPHYRSVLQTRKMAIQSLDFVVEAVSDNKQDQLIADAVRELLDAQAAEFLIGDLSDALGKGYAVVEMLWGWNGKLLQPVEYNWVDPRLFSFDKSDGRTLRIKQKDQDNGIELPKNQFITHIPRLKSGFVMRGGLARTAAWYFLFKNFSLKDWAVFNEVYGMPFRVGKYGASATEEDRNKLLSALRNLGSDGAAAIPDSMQIEFIQSGAKSSADVFKDFCEYCDKQVSKVVLGQTMTTDDGASLAQAKVHNDVRLDILAADAKQVCATLRRDLIKPFIDVNFGAQQEYPHISLPVIQEEDLEKTLNTLEKAVKLGVKIQATELADRLGFGDPDRGAELLSTLEERIALSQAAANDGAETKQTHRIADSHSEDEIDALLAELDPMWESLEQSLTQPLINKINQAQSFDEIDEYLAQNYDGIDDQDYIRALAETTFKARGLGDGRDEP